MAATAQAVHNVRSLDELESWLRSQPTVAYVRLEDYLIKTFPPRREFTIGLITEEASTADTDTANAETEGGIVREMILTVVMVKDDQFEYYSMREST